LAHLHRARKQRAPAHAAHRYETLTQGDAGGAEPKLVNAMARLRPKGFGGPPRPHRSSVRRVTRLDEVSYVEMIEVNRIEQADDHVRILLASHKTVAVDDKEKMGRIVARKGGYEIARVRLQEGKADFQILTETGRPEKP
jgi:hypothetical protein